MATNTAIVTRLNGEKIHSCRRTDVGDGRDPAITTVFSPEIMKARPRRAISVPSVNTSDWIFSRCTTVALHGAVSGTDGGGDEHRGDQSDLLDHGHGDDAGDGGGGPDGKIELAGDDGHANGEGGEAEECEPLEDGEHVVGGEEAIVAQREDGEDHRRTERSWPRSSPRRACTTLMPAVSGCGSR